MNKFILLPACVILFSFSRITAQVAAGVTDNLVIGQKSLQVAAYAPNSFDYDLRQDSMDFNSDGKYDALFSAEAAWVPDYVGGFTGVQSLHSGFEILVDSNHVRALALGDSIDAAQTWSDGDALSDLYSTPFVTRFWGITGQLHEIGDWLPPTSTAYVGFRIITAQQDTLYGWFRVTASVNPNGSPFASLLVSSLWAIQHDPAQKPWVSISKTPQKAVYCPGDYVMFEANTAGAEQIMWHFWDGSTYTSNVVVKILPDSTVTATFEATNQNGSTVVAKTLEISPLQLTAPDIVLDCAHPTATLTAETNIPADICWVVGNDTTCNPTPPPINFPTPITVIAEDEYGCIAVEQIDITLDTGVPGVFIEYDEENHLLIAHSSTPNVTFAWAWVGWPVTNDSVYITQSGTYTVVVTAPNGCISTASIEITIVSADEPLSKNVLVQPNPASNFLQIENRLALDLYFKIYGPAGSLTMESGAAMANSLIRLDVEFLPAGFYFLAACDAAGKLLFFKKFVKQ